MSSQPFVSVVTPFYNTRQYLPECIESVLRQSHQNWEYILVDNQSTDGSSEIAARYAAQCDKIRLVRTERFLTQVENYNWALSLISSQSRYCKLVQADDWIYPECLERMVALAESEDSIGIVSSYRLKGNRLLGEGLQYPQTVMTGRDVCHLQLTTPFFVFGTPTTVLYRSAIVRETSPFYADEVFFDDSEACYRILQSWNFGFVHQVLSYSRDDHDSIRARVGDFGPDILERFLQLSKFGPAYLDERELSEKFAHAKALYYQFLAWTALTKHSGEFWRFHRSILASWGVKFEKLLVAKHLFLESFKLVINPGTTCKRILSRLQPTHTLEAPGNKNRRMTPPRDSLARP